MNKVDSLLAVKQKRLDDSFCSTNKHDKVDRYLYETECWAGHSWKWLWEEKRRRKLILSFRCLIFSSSIPSLNLIVFLLIRARWYSWFRPAIRFVFPIGFGHVRWYVHSILVTHEVVLIAAWSQFYLRCWVPGPRPAGFVQIRPGPKVLTWTFRVQ